MNTNGDQSYAVQYYQFDHLGNVRSVVDENGNVVQHTEYYAFGPPIPRSGAGAATNRSLQW